MNAAWWISGSRWDEQTTKVLFINWRSGGAMEWRPMWLLTTQVGGKRGWTRDSRPGARTRCVSPLASCAFTVELQQAALVLQSRSLEGRNQTNKNYIFETALRRFNTCTKIWSFPGNVIWPGHLAPRVHAIISPEAEPEDSCYFSTQTACILLLSWTSFSESQVFTSSSGSIIQKVLFHHSAFWAGWRSLFWKQLWNQIAWRSFCSFRRHLRKEMIVVIILIILIRVLFCIGLFVHL